MPLSPDDLTSPSEGDLSSRSNSLDSVSADDAKKERKDVSAPLFSLLRSILLLSSSPPLVVLLSTRILLIR